MQPSFLRSSLSARFTAAILFFSLFGWLVVVVVVVVVVVAAVVVVAESPRVRRVSTR